MKKSKIRGIVRFLLVLSLGMLMQKFIAPLLPNSNPIGLRDLISVAPAVAALLIAFGLSGKDE